MHITKTVVQTGGYFVIELTKTVTCIVVIVD